MNIVLNVIIQHGCKCLTLIQNVILHTYWGGNYFFGITVAFLCIYNVTGGDKYIRVLLLLTVWKSGGCWKSSHIFSRCYKLSFSVSCNRTSGFLLTLPVPWISTNWICYYRCLNSSFFSPKMSLLTLVCAVHVVVSTRCMFYHWWLFNKPQAPPWSLGSH